MPDKIITISRQYGSGGREIGDRLAKRLNIPFYDKVKERMDSIDKKRTAYFQFYAGINGRQMENYHLCIDSGLLGIENVVTLIETAYLVHVPLVGSKGYDR